MLNKENTQKRFWEIIKVHYEKECYTDALKDACLYMIQLVQEKSDTENMDGEKLITNVFSEAKPKLLINANQTMTEKDIQRGFGMILRGIICAIRNPISHKRDVEFTKEEADSILMFLNSYIIPKLDDSKDFGYVENWYEYIFVDGEEDSESYSKTLLDCIPKKEKKDLMIHIIENLEDIEQNKFTFFINELFQSLIKKDQDDLIKLLNKNIINTKSTTYLLSFLNHFPKNIWKRLNDLARARIQEKVKKEIKNGQIISCSFNTPENTIGLLGIEASSCLSLFSNQEEIYEILFDKLESSDSEAKYAITNFPFHLQLFEKYADRLINGLKSGNKYYHKIVGCEIPFLDSNSKVLQKIKSVYNAFEENDVKC